MKFFATLFLMAGLGLMTMMHQAKADTTATEITPVKDQRALAELKQMGDALAKAKSMSFETLSMTPIRGPNEQWIHVFSTAKVSMQRPDKLAIVTGGDAFPQRIYFDGQTFTISAPEKKLYSQTPMTGSIDSMLAQASEKSGASFVFSDVLLADPLASWTKDLAGAVYVGESVRNSEKLSHLALTAKDVDWEVWVDKKTHLPRMVYVKYTGEKRSPSVLIEFKKWIVNTKIPTNVFAFKAPQGSIKAELKAPQGGGK